MTKARRFKSRNFGRLLFAYRKAPRLRDVSVWRSVLQTVASAGVDGRRHPAGRLLWLAMRLTAVLCMVLLMWSVTLEYRTSPTVTIPETELYPIRKINYPAIAICNVNRISRAAMIELATELLGFESTVFTANLTLPELTRLLHLLGQLYLREINEADSEAVELLHTILERGYHGYNVNRIMKRLSPKCKHTLLQCSWKGKDRACNDLFLLRRTQDGYCCTFNYARRNDGFGSAQNDVFTSQKIERSTNIGLQYGLSVLLNPHLDDYAYGILPISGFKVLVYDSLNYPDVTSGYLRELLICPKTETYVDLNAILFYTTKDVQKYDIRERDCLFRTEQSQIFHGYYSFSDCILHCRIREIFQLCNCVPFFYPQMAEESEAHVCNLKDLSCLKKYRERWRNVKPRLEELMVPFNESAFKGTSGYLSCNCFPSCDDVTYSIQSLSSIPLSLSELTWGRNKYPIENQSVVHIYFGKDMAIRLRQDELFYWYELMSNYGGICSLFLGISIINVIEVLYRLIVRITDSGSTSPSAAQPEVGTTAKRESAKAIATISEAVPPLHWRELTGVLSKQRSDPSDQLVAKLALPKQ